MSRVALGLIFNKILPVPQLTDEYTYDNYSLNYLHHQSRLLAISVVLNYPLTDFQHCYLKILLI